MAPRDGLGAGRAETNTVRMIFRLVAAEKKSNHSGKVQLGASRRLLCSGTPPKKWSHDFGDEPNRSHNGHCVGACVHCAVGSALRMVTPELKIPKILLFDTKKLI